MSTVAKIVLTLADPFAVRRFLAAARAQGERGQALLILVAAMLAVLAGAVVVGSIAHGLTARGDRQRAADLAALAGAKAMRAAFPRLFVPATYGAVPNPAHLERDEYLALGRRAAIETARRNDASDVEVSFPSADLMAPTRIRVAVRDAIEVPGAGAVAPRAAAEAELSPPSALPLPAAGGAGEYAGPFAYRQGKPMRPDVALGFDRLAAAARKDGHDLIVVSAFRTDAEQAVLFARHPDPKWVAPPGTSLHRLATELDLGPISAYGWLDANAPDFHFVRRYAWEEWHFGYVLNAASGAATGATPRATDAGGREGGERDGGAVPGFVPDRFAPLFARAAQRWNVSAALLAAQAWRESSFNPYARSAAGALGIAQFMPGTAADYGLTDPTNSAAAIDAQAHLMRDLLRRFASVPLALAAYNAGPGRVAQCMCIPPIPETQAYVAAILGMLGGIGDQAGAGAAALAIRLVA
jgi:hypothetical protein